MSLVTCEQQEENSLLCLALCGVSCTVKGMDFFEATQSTQKRKEYSDILTTDKRVHNINIIQKASAITYNVCNIYTCSCVLRRVKKNKWNRRRVRMKTHKLERLFSRFYSL